MEELQIEVVTPSTKFLRIKCAFLIRVTNSALDACITG